MIDIRKKNLKMLVSKHGSQEALAHTLGVTPGYISQMLNKTRPITEKTTQKWEEKLGLPPRWFDVDQEDDFAEQNRLGTVLAEQDMAEIREEQPNYEASLKQKIDLLSPDDLDELSAIVDKLLSAK